MAKQAPMVMAKHTNPKKRDKQIQDRVKRLWQLAEKLYPNRRVDISAKATRNVPIRIGELVYEIWTALGESTDWELVQVGQIDAMSRFMRHEIDRGDYRG